jgi:hypothetical protein
MSLIADEVHTAGWACYGTDHKRLMYLEGKYCVSSRPSDEGHTAEWSMVMLRRRPQALNVAAL